LPYYSDHAVLPCHDVARGARRVVGDIWCVGAGDKRRRLGNPHRLTSPSLAR